jgi:uncharacterized membrane protein
VLGVFGTHGVNVTVTMTSLLKIIGATLVMLGIGLLLWRNPTARRRMTGWTRFLAGSAKRTGDHR